MSLAGQEETMDQGEAFLAAWMNFSPEGKPPDTEFLQFCSCDGETSSNEVVVERISLCKERLERAINVLKSEGFILKWLTDVLHVKDVNQSHSELDKVLNLFFPSAFEPWSSSSCKSSDACPSIGFRGRCFKY